MRRLLFGTLWFVLLFSIGATILSSIVPESDRTQTAVAALGTPDSVSDHFSYGATKGYVHGREIGSKYGIYLFFGALGLAGLGTFYGVLPGTKRRTPSKSQRPEQRDTQ